MKKIKVKKLNPEDDRPILPTRGSKLAAGLDLYSIETFTLRPGVIRLVSTGIVLEIPEGHEGQVRPRSGLAVKHGVTVLNAPGTIDEDYTGEAKVLLHLAALIPGERASQLLWQRSDRSGERVSDRLRRLAIGERDELAEAGGPLDQGRDAGRLFAQQEVPLPVAGDGPV